MTKRDTTGLKTRISGWTAFALLCAACNQSPPKKRTPEDGPPADQTTTGATTGATTGGEEATSATAATGVNATEVVTAPAPGEVDANGNPIPATSAANPAAGGMQPAAGGATQPGAPSTSPGGAPAAPTAKVATVTVATAMIVGSGTYFNKSCVVEKGKQIKVTKVEPVQANPMFNYIEFEELAGCAVRTGLTRKADWQWPM